MLAKEITFKCPRCKMEIRYVPKDKDLERIKISGISDLAFDHGDHILAIFFDKDGKVRAWHVLDKANPVTFVEQQEGWVRVNSEIITGFRVNFLIADRNRKVFNDAFWKLNPNFVLKYIETADKIARILVDEVEVWVLPFKRYCYALGNVSIGQVRDIIRLLYLLEDFEGLLNDYDVLKITLCSIENFNLSKIIIDSAIRLIRELDYLVNVDKILLKFNIKHSSLSFKNRDDFYIALAQLNFPLKNRQIASILFEKKVLIDYIINYHIFRELGIVKMV